MNDMEGKADGFGGFPFIYALMQRPLSKYNCVRLSSMPGRPIFFEQPSWYNPRLVLRNMSCRLARFLVAIGPAQICCDEQSRLGILKCPSLGGWKDMVGEEVMWLVVSGYGHLRRRLVDGRQCRRIV